MYNKKMNEKPLFAEEKPCDDEVRQQATNKDYNQRALRDFSRATFSCM